MLAPRPPASSATLSPLPLKLPSSLGVLRGQVVQGGHAETGDNCPPALLGQELVPHGLLGLVRVLDLEGGQSVMSPRPWPSPGKTAPLCLGPNSGPTHGPKEHLGSTNSQGSDLGSASRPGPARRPRGTARPRPCALTQASSPAPLPDPKFCPWPRPRPKIKHQVLPPGPSFHSKPCCKFKVRPLPRPETQGS